MTKNWSFAKITDILLKKNWSVIVSQNHYLKKIVDVHPLEHLMGSQLQHNCFNPLPLNVYMCCPLHWQRNQESWRLQVKERIA